MSQEVIIFEGPDGVGKTEISKALSKELKIPYFRMDSQHDNWRRGKFKTALEFDQTYISSFLRQTGHSVIFDRAYPSEFVYSRAFGRDTNSKVLFEVDTEFAKMGTVIVVPLRRDYTKSREDEVILKSELPRIHQGYLEFCEWTQCRTIQMYVDDLGNDLEQEFAYLIPQLLNPDGSVDQEKVR